MSFQQGLSGLNAASKNLDVIGNNIANSSTVGFKGSAAEFADVFASSAGGAVGGSSVGIGSSVSAVVQNFTQGNISVSNNPLDVAINGGGFYRLSKGGTVSYTRNGQFQLDKNGYLVTATGENVTGYPANSNGKVAIAGAPINLRVSNADLPPAATTKAELGVNLDSRNTVLSPASFDMNNPATYQGGTSMSVYDTLGNAHALSLYMVKTAPNQWDVFAANDGTMIAGGGANGQVGSLTFNSSGAITSSPTIAMALPVSTGAAPIAVTLDMSASTQFGSTFGVSSLSQDGYTSGKLSGFYVATDGTVTGRYTNGQTSAQGQLVLANFNAPQNLQLLGSNQWGETSASGVPLIGVPGTGSLGVLQSGGIEASNVDIAGELVNLITAQRVYQANAQTIKTQDSVLQTLVNLR